MHMYKRTKEMTLFERATRKKIRFNTTKGNVSTEDLWDLPLDKLDAIAITLHGKVSDGATVSFIDAPNTSASFRDDKMRFDIVKRVIEVRLGDKERAEKTAATKAKKQRVMEILDKKKDASLEDMSVEELEAMLAE
jgi:hypothetical protein